mmetsp:Transcript_103222/g.296387  ORF Transcript_103222/g.296387 Transcript_103222/m.296387 type:complete len:227 (+) Transcript_103222:946-1626(+)
MRPRGSGASLHARTGATSAERGSFVVPLIVGLRLAEVNRLVVYEVRVARADEVLVELDPHLCFRGCKDVLVHPLQVVHPGQVDARARVRARSPRTLACARRGCAAGALRCDEHPYQPSELLRLDFRVVEVTWVLLHELAAHGVRVRRRRQVLEAHPVVVQLFTARREFENDCRRAVPQREPRRVDLVSVHWLAPTGWTSLSLRRSPKSTPSSSSSSSRVHRLRYFC